MVLVASTTKCLGVLLCVIAAISTKGQDLKNYKDTQVKFEVLSVRVMTSEEILRRQSDNLAPIDVSIRLRLTNSGPTTIYYYTNWKDHIIPYRHAVKETKNGIVWFDGFQKGESKRTLGIGKLTLGGGGAWLMLPAETSIEWPSFDSTIRSGERHAETFFMKVGENGTITEVVSDFYTVPTRDSK